MLRYFVTLLVISAGVRANSPLCSLDSCGIVDEPDMVPETEEEFKKSCENAIQHYECKVEHAEECGASEQYKNIQKTYLDVKREMCDENSLYHTVVIQNLKCFNRIPEEKHSACEPDSESITEVTEFLNESGLITFPDDVFQRHYLHICLANLLETACFAYYFEEECGKEVVDVFVDVSKRLTKANGCEQIDYLLPIFMRQNPLENGESNNYVDILKNRK